MKTGRPRKLFKPVTVCIVIEESTLRQIDDLRMNLSRGDYLNILSISDNKKANTIIRLKEELKIKDDEILDLKKQANNECNNNIKSFQKAIHSNFQNQYRDVLERMPKNAKKLWADCIGCKTIELINYI